MLMTEINVNWERAGRRNSFQNIGRHWFKTCKPSCTFNHHQKIIDNKTKWQLGGHAIVSRDEISRRVHKYDHDNRQIGRWTSQLIKGKENLNTRVVSVYVPRPSKDYTHQRIFCQQQTALLKLGVSGAVLTIFWSDFWAQIDKWLEQGNSLIIDGDWNTDIRNKEFLKPFEERNLIPAVHSKHGYDLPATHNAGSLPIDEIFLSSTIELKNSGYLEHGHSSGDHRLVWVDVTKKSTIGDKLPPITTFQARKLKCTDPRVVDRYNQLLKRYLMKERYMQRLEKLVLAVKKVMTKPQSK